MKEDLRKGHVVVRVILATILFSVFRMIDAFSSLVNMMGQEGWSFSMILIASTLIQLIAAGFVVLVVMPPSLGFKKWRHWLSGYLKIDRKIILSGTLSFLGFCALAALISVSMGIFKGDVSVAFANPDIRPDPDVIGWGYFLLALVPGIWEELAFRGWIQSKARTAFSLRTSILLSSLFFALFHLSNLLTQSPMQAIPGVVMAFFFGIGWGYMTIRIGSVIPAMISHYLIDSMGQVFLGVDGADPALAMGFFVLLTLLFPVFNLILTKITYREEGRSPLASGVSI
jgi:membrane protease YdiL (CAAX protease family)